MSKLITADEIIACNPCEDYPPALVRKLIGDGKTAAEIVASGHDETGWVLTRVLARRNRGQLIAWVWSLLADPAAVAMVPRSARPAWDAMLAAPGNASLAYAAFTAMSTCPWIVAQRRLAQSAHAASYVTAHATFYVAAGSACTIVLYGTHFFAPGWSSIVPFFEEQP